LRERKKVALSVDRRSIEDWSLESSGDQLMIEELLSSVEFEGGLKGVLKLLMT
jgi:hypothetical protein